MATARIFKSGNSQALRLPREFRFDVDEVEILRRGDEIILRTPHRNLAAAYDALLAMGRHLPSDALADPPPEPVPLWPESALRAAPPKRRKTA